MKKLFLFILVLNSGCKSHVYIGESENKYCAKNGIKKDKIFFIYKNGTDSIFGYDPYKTGSYFYIYKRHDTISYPFFNRKNNMLTYHVFSNEKCIRIDTTTNYLAEPPRKQQ